MSIKIKLNTTIQFRTFNINKTINKWQTKGKQTNFFFQNVKKDIMARPAAQNAGAAQMEKRVIKTAGSVIAVAFLTF